MGNTAHKLRVESGWDGEDHGYMVIRRSDYDLIDGTIETYFDRAIREARMIGWEHTGYILGQDGNGAPVEVHMFDFNADVIPQAGLNRLWDALVNYPISATEAIPA